MAYTPAPEIPESCYHCEHCKKHDLDKALKVIEKFIGIKMFVVSGGPSVVDPCGEIRCYIGFRDKHHNAIALTVSSNLGISIHKEEKSKQ